MSAPNIISLVVALLPTIVIMFLVLRNARFKREPVKKIASVFVISALSCIPAAILEYIGEFVLAFIFIICGVDVSNMSKSTETVYYLLQYIFIVGIAEEACKFFTFKWIIFNDRDFDNTYDGVIYGAASALGFATLENVMYIFLVSDDPLKTAALRAVLSVPMHAITGIFMGYYFGISKYRRYNNIQPKSRPEIPAFIFSVLLHGIYDFIVTVEELYSDDRVAYIFSWVMLVVIMLFIYCLIWVTIRRAKRETHNIYNRYYYEQLDGTLQDMFGGKTTSKRRFFGMPFPVFYRGQPGAFNPYNPYAGFTNVPQPPQQYGGNFSYMYGTQQPYNPYYSQPIQQNTAPQYYGAQQGNNYNYNYNYNYNQNYSYNQQGYNRQNAVQTARAIPATVSAIKICPHCGARLSPKANFCSECGRTLSPKSRE